MANRSSGSQEPKSGSGRALIGVAALLVAGAAGVVALLVLRPERAAPRAEPRPEPTDPVLEKASERPAIPTTAPERATSSARVAPTVAPPPSAKPLPPIDLFTPDVAETLRKTHEVTMGGGLLPVERMKELYQLGKDHPGDARPHLVMAEDAVNRGWDDFAVSHYLRAQKEDPRARQDPRMLKDLVALASDKRSSGKAADALATVYGATAVSAVEEAIAAAGEKGDPALLERLEALSRRLGSAP